MPDVGDNKHIGAVRIEFEPIRNILAQHRRRKGTETLAVFDLRKLPSRNHCTSLSRASIRADPIHLAKRGQRYGPKPHYTRASVRMPMKSLDGAVLEPWLGPPRFAWGPQRS